MIATNHTPGPWKYNMTSRASWKRNGFSIVGCKELGQTSPLIGEVLAKINGKGEANARLIVAAPDLLQALSRLLDSVTGVDQVSAVNGARAAIAKATGAKGTES